MINILKRRPIWPELRSERCRFRCTCKYTCNENAWV